MPFDAAGFPPGPPRPERPQRSRPGDNLVTAIITDRRLLPLNDPDAIARWIMTTGDGAA